MIMKKIKEQIYCQEVGDDYKEKVEDAQVEKKKLLKKKNNPNYGTDM